MLGRRTVTALAIAAASTASLAAGAARAIAGTTGVTVRAGQPTGHVNRSLIGFDFHFGGRPPRAIRPLHPHFVRVDASLEQVSPAPGVLRLVALQRHLRQIRKIGAAPLVILDYTPAWLGQPVAPLGDRTKTEPSDLGKWQALVKRVAAALARGPGRVRWFEAWNEPDLPSYWAGTPQGFLDTAAASAAAVHAAAMQTRLPLRFGGPASFYPDAAQISSFVSRLRQEGLPPAFVSWHYYANYPCLGPDGPENPGDPSSVALQRTLGCVNPSASPTFYSTGTQLVRSAIGSASGGDQPPALILDEWNLSAGGLDRRMTSNVGAAFDVGTLITFQADRLDASAFYQATDTDARPGGWGTVALGGQRRPGWWAFRFWRELASLTVRLAGDDPGGGFWALASRNRSRRRVTVLLASFSASSPQARSIALRVLGLHRGRLKATLARIDAGHAGGGRASQVRVARGGTLKFTLPPQAVVLVKITVRRGRPHRHH